LRQGGAFEKALRRGKQLHLVEGATVRSRLLEGELDSIRRAYARGRLHDDGKVRTPERRFAHALLPEFRSRDSVDPVLPFCLATAAGFEKVAGSWKEDAWGRYSGDHEAYEAIFADLLPLEFRTARKALTDEQAYTSGSNPTAAGDWPVYRQHLYVRRKRPLQGVSTGLPSLDAALRGPRGLTLLSGVTGVGKTTLALAMAAAALRKHADLAVLYVSLEMSRTVLFDRLISLESGVPYCGLLAETYADADCQRLQAAEERLYREVLPRLRIVGPRSLPGPEGQILEPLLRHRSDLLLHARAGRALVVIDRFQDLIPPTDDADDVKADRRLMSLLAAAQHQTCTAAHPEGDPFVVISKVRKDAGPTGLESDDLLGSGDLGSTAGTVLFL
jgi:hypothetical protein